MKLSIPQKIKPTDIFEFSLGREIFMFFQTHWALFSFNSYNMNSVNFQGNDTLDDNILKHVISAFDAFCFLLSARPPSNPWSLLHHLFGPWLKQSCIVICGLPWWLSGKESACQCRRYEFDPWVRKIPWRRKWQPTPVFLPGKSHRQEETGGRQSLGSKSQTWFIN